MLYARNLIVALISPWGRLPAAPFAIICMFVIGAHIAIQVHITQLGEDLPPYNSWSMSFFVLMWISFSATSRRFHDGGKTALFLVPLVVITFASYLAVFDDMHLANSAFEEDRDILRWAERARFALQIAGMVAMIAALLRPGDSGDNAFGPEFAHSSHGALSSTASTRVAAQPAPARRTPPAAPGDAAPAVRRQDFLADGPRGRITGAESSRRRPDGFGRR